MKNLFKLFSIIILIINSNSNSFAAEKVEYLKTDWSFKGLFGKFDRASLQRGYQVYTEVCAACHSMKYISYRNHYTFCEIKQNEFRNKKTNYKGEF